MPLIYFQGSISATTRLEFDSAGLTTRLLEVVTKFLSKVTQIVLTATAGIAITPVLGSLLNELMPSLLTALESAFPSPEHFRILKGIIFLIAVRIVVFFFGRDKRIRYSLGTCPLSL